MFASRRARPSITARCCSSLVPRRLHQVANLALELSDPFLEVTVALDYYLQLAVFQNRDAPRMLSAQRNLNRLARDSHRIDHREDSFDFFECNGLQHVHASRGYVFT